MPFLPQHHITTYYNNIIKALNETETKNPTKNHPWILTAGALPAVIVQVSVMSDLCRKEMFLCLL